MSLALKLAPFVLSSLRPISLLDVGCIFDHQEPLFPLSTRFALCFEIYAALPSSLQEDPGEQAAGHNPGALHHGRHPTSVPEKVGLGQWSCVSQRDPHWVVKGKAERRGPSFAHSQRPFCILVLLYFLHFIVSTSLAILIYNKLHCIIVHKGSH